MGWVEGENRYGVAGLVGTPSHPGRRRPGPGSGMAGDETENTKRRPRVERLYLEAERQNPVFLEAVDTGPFQIHRLDCPFWSTGQNKGLVASPCYGAACVGRRSWGL